MAAGFSGSAKDCLILQYVDGTLKGLVAEGNRCRVYLPAIESHSMAADIELPKDTPTAEIEHWSGCTNSVVYGLDRFEKLFTNRQLAALICFSQITEDLVKQVQKDALRAGYNDSNSSLEHGGNGALAYSQAICVYLAFAIDKLADLGNNLVGWEAIAQCPRHLFGKQAIPMVWDYAEANPLSTSSGSWDGIVDGIHGAFIKAFGTSLSESPGFATQADAQTQKISAGKVISIDPPYYDNVPYSNLSDFFYIWMRRNLKAIYPNIFRTRIVPRIEELVATATRHGGKDSAEAFFLTGMTAVMQNLAGNAHPAFPITIYYAFRQSETIDAVGTSSTGWQAFLQAVMNSGLMICGTWPVRTENSSRMRGQGSNALASSIVLVCRKRPGDAPTVTRREFIRELDALLPDALLDMTRGGISSPVAAVDLSQSIIGPGMAIFSQYASVLEADGNPMGVRTALHLINRFLAEDDFDYDTQFCLHWFETNGWAIGKYGEADVLARAKGTSASGLAEAGVVESGKGDVRLLRWAEMPKDWSPESDTRTPIWEALHQLIRALYQDSEAAAGSLLARMPARAESIRSLAYRLYTLCERKGWAEDARAYNELITAWSSIEQAATAAGLLGSQTQMDI